MRIILLGLCLVFTAWPLHALTAQQKRMYWYRAESVAHTLKEKVLPPKFVTQLLAKSRSKADQVLVERAVKSWSQNHAADIVYLNTGNETAWMTRGVPLLRLVQISDKPVTVAINGVTKVKLSNDSPVESLLAGVRKAGYSLTHHGFENILILAGDLLYRPYVAEGKLQKPHYLKQSLADEGLLFPESWDKSFAPAWGTRAGITVKAAHCMGDSVSGSLSDESKQDIAFEASRSQGIHIKEKKFTAVGSYEAAELGACTRYADLEAKGRDSLSLTRVRANLSHLCQTGRGFRPALGEHCDKLSDRKSRAAFCSAMTGVLISTPSVYLYCEEATCADNMIIPAGTALENLRRFQQFREKYASQIKSGEIATEIQDVRLLSHAKVSTLQKSRIQADILALTKPSVKAPTVFRLGDAMAGLLECCEDAQCRPLM